MGIEFMDDRGFILLACLHTREPTQPPTGVGEKAKCGECGKEEEIVSVHEAPWHYEISCENCRFKFSAGKSTMLLRIMKGKHERKWPEHKVSGAVKVYD